MLHDLIYALRGLRRSPGFAASAVLALTLGIGANTAVFSVVYEVLLKPLPYDHPGQLVRLSESNQAKGVADGVVSAGTFVDWRSRSRALESVAVFAPFFNGETVWDIGGRAQIVKTAGVSPGILTVLRVQPILGRPFRSEFDAAPPGVMGQFLIGYGLWQRVFGGASDVVGRTVMLEGRLPREIIGVMPRGFDFPDGTEAWTSVPLPVVKTAERRARSFGAIGRLAAGATIDGLRRELTGISAQLAVAYPAANGGWTAGVEPLTQSNAATARLALLALLAAVGGVLLIGCSNVANLLLARATARRADLIVRLALGASRWRLVRQSLIEAGLLVASGAAAGVAIGGVLARLLVRLAPPQIAPSGGVAMNGAVLLFAAAASALCVLIIGVAPALHVAHGAWRTGIRAGARAATTQSAGIRRWVIGGEAAIVVLLLTGAFLFLRTFIRLRNVDLGFDSGHAVVAEMRWPVGHLLQAAPGTRPWPHVRRAVDGLLAAVEAVPGVDAAGLITEIPLTSDPFAGTVWRPDAPGASVTTPPADTRDRWRADLAVVTAGYFTALEIPIVRGRNFTTSDQFNDDLLNHSSTPRVGSAIVNTAFASRYFPGIDPVGREIIVDDDREFGAERTIVGVVADVHQRSIAEGPRPAVFIPHGQHPDVIRPSIVLRTSLPFGSVSSTIRERVTAFDPQLVVLRIRPMDAVVTGALSRPRFNLLLMSSFAAIALALSALGIYGVLAYLVVQRTREIGIRMALGARTADVMRLVVSEGMTPVVAGTLCGLAASAAATRLVRTLLFGVTPVDAVSFIAAPTLLAAVALLACYLPARRALRVDPLVALRDE